jgi:DNA-binding transcriptional MerR regulator
VPDRSHLSIGEVLSLLREEFPDVTISKIRFLESQGLVDPERTPSGYRKFYEHDIERLRWILRQQRENFLPLKVIRGRLAEGGTPNGDAGGEEVPDGAPEAPAAADGGHRPPGAGAPPEDLAAAGGSGHGAGVGEVSAAGQPAGAARGGTPTGPGSGAGVVRSALSAPPEAPLAPGAALPPAIPDPAAPPGGTHAPATAHGPEAPGARAPGGATPAFTGEQASPPPAGRQAPGTATVPGMTADGGAPAAGSLDAPGGGRPAGAAVPPRSAPTPAGRSAGNRGSAATGGPPGAPNGGGRTPGAGPGREAGGPPPSPGAPARQPAPGPASAPGDEETFTLEELAASSGLTTAAVADLQQYGLVAPAQVGGVAYYDRDALAVARAAAGFARYGVEARHLRAWRNAADRQASLFEQVVVPLLKQRNPQARQLAAATLRDLTAAGGELHAALLRRALRNIR